MQIPSQTSPGLREGESLAQISQIAQPIVLETKEGMRRRPLEGFAQWLDPFVVLGFMRITSSCAENRLHGNRATTRRGESTEVHQRTWSGQPIKPSREEKSLERPLTQVCGC